jgi:hypothetical protein
VVVAEAVVEAGSHNALLQRETEYGKSVSLLARQNAIE